MRNLGTSIEGLMREMNSGHCYHVGDSQLMLEDRMSEAGANRSASNFSAYSLYMAWVSRVYHSIDTELFINGLIKKQGPKSLKKSSLFTARWKKN